MEICYYHKLLRVIVNTQRMIPNACLVFSRHMKQLSSKKQRDLRVNLSIHFHLQQKKPHFQSVRESGSLTPWPYGSNSASPVMRAPEWGPITLPSKPWPNIGASSNYLEDKCFASGHGFVFPGSSAL